MVRSYRKSNVVNDLQKLLLSDLLLLNRLAAMRDFVVSIFFVERTIALGLRNIEKTLKLTKVGLK